MPFFTRNSMIAGSILVVVATAVAGGFVWSGLYNIAADDTHTRPVHAMLQLVRDRSITARARKLHPPPNLADPARIRQGAGNYEAMCVDCHLAPGMAATELSKGLYPPPPDLTKADIGDPSHHFWVIKHGIKASGMPAWGKSMDDEYIWNMVAFLKVLPTLDAQRYRTIVDSSGGHAHGGGETMPHADGHGEDGPDEHARTDKAAGSQGTATGAPAGGRSGPTPRANANANANSVEHRHADGTVESHPTPTPAPVPVPAEDDGHDHQH